MNNSLTLFIYILLLIASSAVDADELRLELGQIFNGPLAQYTRVQPGDEVTIELSASNVSDALGTGVTLRYVWPEGLDLINIVPNPAAAVTVQPDNNVIDWYIGDLFSAAVPGNQSSAHLSLTGKVRHAAAGKTLHGDLSVIASDQPMSWEASPAPAFGVAGIATVDLSVTAVGSSTQSGAFHNLTYNVTVSNAGPEAAAEVFLALEIGDVTADLIENATLTGSAGTTCDVNLPGCIYMNLGSGESLSFTATGQVLVDDGPVDIMIGFIVATNDVDTDASNDRAFARVSLPAPPDDGGGGTTSFLLIVFLAACAALRMHASHAGKVLLAVCVLGFMTPAVASTYDDEAPECETPLRTLVSETWHVPIAGSLWEKRSIRLRLVLPLYRAGIALHHGYADFAAYKIGVYIARVEHYVARGRLVLGVPADPDLVELAHDVLACIAGDPGDNNEAPIANAGVDIAVALNQVVVLDGRASADPDGDSLTYAWSLVSVPDGSAAVLNDTTIADPAFFVDVPGNYIASLVVNDGELNSDPDEVEITTTNTAPVANAGPDQTALVGDSVTLDASASTDVDGDFLIYSWTLIESPTGSTATLSDVNALMPTFVIDLSGRYVAELTVNDGEFDSTSDTVIIDTLNSAPVADAGPDQSQPLGAEVTLDGSGSFDVDGDPLSFIWTLTDIPTGSAAVLSDNQVLNPTFVMDQAGAYTASLVVNDGFADSAADTVMTTTENSIPVADAGPNVEAFVGDVVILDGNGSSDADGDALTFAWSLLSGPSTPVVNEANMETANFVAEAVGEYVAQLIVNDGSVDSDPDTSTVQVAVQPIADADGDGLSDAEEVALGTDPNNPDSDGDGLSDGEEVNVTGTSPLDPDSDGDGIGDADDTSAISYILDTTLQSNAVIGENGGSIELAESSGRRFELQIPVGSVQTDVEFSLTSVSEINGLPDGILPIAAVRLGPAGVDLIRYVELRVELAATDRTGSPLILLLTDDDGNEPALQPLLGEDPFAAKLTDPMVAALIPHFSTIVVAEAESEASLPTYPPLSLAEARARHTIDVRMTELAILSEINVDISFFDDVIVTGALLDWYNNPVDGLQARMANLAINPDISDLRSLRKLLYETQFFYIDSFSYLRDNNPDYMAMEEALALQQAELVASYISALKEYCNTNSIDAQVRLFDLDNFAFSLFAPGEYYSLLNEEVYACRYDVTLDPPFGAQFVGRTYDIEYSVRLQDGTPVPQEISVSDYVGVPVSRNNYQTNLTVVAESDKTFVLTSPNGAVGASVFGMSFGDSPDTEATVAYLPDIAGAYLGQGTGATAQCIDPEDNGPGSGSESIVLSTQQILNATPDFISVRATGAGTIVTSLLLDLTITELPNSSSQTALAGTATGIANYYLEEFDEDDQQLYVTVGSGQLGGTFTASLAGNSFQLGFAGSDNFCGLVTGDLALNSNSP